MPRTENKSFYHYKVVETAPNDGSKKSYYYHTQEEIMSKYNISQKLIQVFMKDENYISKKVPHIKIYKVQKPAILTIKAEYQD